MSKIMSFKQQNVSSNTKLVLSKEDRAFLFKKVEYSKKKKISDSKNDIYELFNGEKNVLNTEEVEKMLKSLEYTFKKSENPILLKILNFLPNIAPIKYSILSTKEKRDNREKNDL